MGSNRIDAESKVSRNQANIPARIRRERDIGDRADEGRTDTDLRDVHTAIGPLFEVFLGVDAVVVVGADGILVKSPALWNRVS